MGSSSSKKKKEEGGEGDHGVLHEEYALVRIFSWAMDVGIFLFTPSSHSVDEKRGNIMN